jgi:hypothetical protein
MSHAHVMAERLRAAASTLTDPHDAKLFLQYADEFEEFVSNKRRRRDRQKNVE